MSNEVPEINPFAFWAKLPRKKDEYPPTKFHPLLCHMLDVAAVAQALWDNVLTQRSRQRIAKALGFEEDNLAEAGVWLSFLAGLHDLGKASPVFQLQPEAQKLLHFYQSLTASSLVKKGAWHGWITATELPEILESEWKIEKPLAKRLAVLIGGHHGSFPRSGERQKLRRDNPTDRDPRVGKGNWPEARMALTKEIASILFGSSDVQLPDSNNARIVHDNADAMILAGLVSVADWLGSDEHSFPYIIHAVNGEFDEPNANTLQGYFHKAQQQAQDALRKTGWLDRLPSAPQRPLAKLFSYLTAPDPFTANSLQEAVEKLADEIMEPSLVIVEAPMGEGKTEAALYLADRWNLPPLGLEGCYFALPTQATSNQIYGRVRRFLEHRYPGRDINYQLLHGFADLHEGFQMSKERSRRQVQPPPAPIGISGEQGEGEDTISLANVIAAEWFTHRKRALLAPFGVGTVDQALLAALQTRHVFVRHFGLAHKTIIVDEVHAYDAYMTELLKCLLQWLAALGSSVVLLSATLPAKRRKELLQAYAEGVLEKQAAGAHAASIAEADYPRVSVISAKRANSYHVPGSTTGRTLRIKWIDGALPEPEEESFSLGEALQEALIAGGCVAVICNTVGRAQDMFQALRDCFELGAKRGLPVPDLDLFHARFLFGERAKREKRAVSRFGKSQTSSDKPENLVAENDQVNRPTRAVLVATQVIEQSLDLDFDLMVSDFAPIDLLLQRSGRVHRHKRDNRYRLTTPTLWVCAPTEENDVPVFEKGTEVIYEDWQHVLLRSWFELKKRTGQSEPSTALVSIPHDISEMIEAAYKDQDAPADASPALRQAWATTREEQETRLEKLAKRAAGVSIAPPLDPGDLLNEWNKKLVEDDPEVDPKLQALTRPEPNVQVVCLLPDEIAQAKLGKKPDRETALFLLGRSVSLTNRQLLSDLLKRPAKSSWKESPFLRNHRLLEFDANRECTVGKITLRLDEELGLCIRYPKNKEE